MNPHVVRIFDVDFYMSSPAPNLDVTFSQFRGSATVQVPVIRVFGSTDVGKKICVHIHGIFPYFYIPYDGGEPQNGLMYRIASNLDKAINISLGQASSNQQHIYKIVLVSGIPFYGYHCKKHQFFKVYLYNPMLIKRVNNLLFNESVLGKIYQPHEIHLSFTLQFMIDYNLHGMSNLVLSQVKFRKNIGIGESEEFNDENLIKVSSCELECDTLGEHILNRKEIESGNLAANPGITTLWEDERQRRRNKKEDSQLPHYLSLSKTNVPPTESHVLFRNALKNRLLLLSQDVDKIDINLSVYPAECSEHNFISNCSMIDFHSPINSQSDTSQDLDLDQTLMNETLNITIDENVQNLVDVLNDLENDADDVEDDSILSQISKNEVDEIEEDHDMTITVEACEDLLNKTLQFSKENGGSQVVKIGTPEECTQTKKKILPDIPQLDGNPDSDDDNSVSKISNIERESKSMFFKFKMEKSRRYGLLKGNDEMILHTQKNDISLACLPESPNCMNESIVLKIETLHEKAPINYSIQIVPPICPLKHKYWHVENFFHEQLYHPKIIEEKKLNQEIIQSIIDKKHEYFSAASVGERVALKHSILRNTLMLKSILEYPCELVCICENLRLTQVATKKRDMPSLNSNYDESFCSVPKIPIWKPIKNYPLNTKIDGAKRIINRKTFFHRKNKERSTKYNPKRYLLLQKIYEQCNKCWEQVNRGVKPSFKVIPGSRPYIFKSQRTKNMRSMQTVTKSTNRIQLTRTVISNQSISSNVRIEQDTDTGCDINQNEITETIETVSVLSRTIEQKRTSIQSKKGGNYTDEINKKLAPKEPLLKKTKSKKSTKNRVQKVDEEIKISMQNINEEIINNGNESIKKTRSQKPILLKSFEEILKAQKNNEAQFFTSVDDLMDNYTISENKLLKSTKNGIDCSEVLHNKVVLNLDGAFDDSDEDVPSKAQSSSGQSTSNPLPIDLRKAKKVESKIVSLSRDNMEKIKKIINFDSSSHLDVTMEKKVVERRDSGAQSSGTIFKADSAGDLRDLSNFLFDSSVNALVETQYNQSTVQQIPDARFMVSCDISNNRTNANKPPTEMKGLPALNVVNTSAMYDFTKGFIPLPCCSKNENPSFYVPPNWRVPTKVENTIYYEEDWVSSDDENFNRSNSTPASNLLAENNGADSVYFKPTYRPPTSLDVKNTLSIYGIPLRRPKEPFYSNVNDASGSMEVGYNVLKIKTLTTMDVPNFDSSFSGLDQFRGKFYPQSSMGQNLRYFFCQDDSCLVTPAISPPSRRQVKYWLEQNSKPKTVVENVPAKKSKIYLASSQDNLSDNDMSMDLTLTMSPTTPKCDLKIDQHESNISSASLVTPESYCEDVSKENHCLPLTPTSLRSLPTTPTSSKSRGSSPVLGKPKRKRRLEEQITLRKSEFLSHSSEHSDVISGVSLNNTYGFQCSAQNYQNARASVKYEYLTILSMELHINTRGDFKPNPQYDSIQAIFYCISNDVEENTIKPRKCEGIFAINSTSEDQAKSSFFLNGTGISCDIKYVKDELELIEEFTKFVIHWDPDILLGYEIQMLSWGYFIERCFNLGMNIIPEISRVKDKHLKFNEKETGDLRVTGRVVLDLWRLLRHEIAIQSYTIQSTVYEILHRRIPKYSFKDLTIWWSHPTSLFRHRTVTYYMTCVRCQLQILERLDFVGRTSELARLFGIQFYEVLSRGSQFRVESMMLRLAKPLNYVAVSPSVQQRAKMRAPEHIALVLEPESKLYTDPVIVLDFQSLYPSIIIAYNYCFSTCLGRVELLGKNTPFEFGASNLKVSKDRVKLLASHDLLNFSPCGVAFVKKSVRDGIMPRMLREILDTRLMVKKSMKENKGDDVLQKVLHSRQLGLKLIANVTYGYTAANFSGRMPSVELGDSIVSKARETLQKTITLVDENKEWGARVVYGDTDSLFVLCPGKSRAEAFAIGENIVKAVGCLNPDPVKLKLEKVYQPCILQTKKRYVGYMYESPEQEVPTYDAKGIETVRRDGCPAVSKMLEKTLRILFDTRDVSKVKEYCMKQFSKIISGRISIKDLTFAKEFRGLTGYRPGACVPSLELAKKWVKIDKRAEPRRGERVPYVIVNGPPGLPLIRMVRSPYELLKDPALRPNALYYITRVIIPPLNRCFNLIGADLHQWFHQMPRKHLQYLPTSTSPTKKSTISHYFISTFCAVCGVQTQNGLCDKCLEKPQETVIILEDKCRQWESSYNNCKLICSSCTQILDEPKCISLDCPVLYRLNKTSRDLQQADHIRHLLSQYFDIV